MTVFTDSPSFASTAALNAAVSASGGWGALTTFSVAGVGIAASGPSALFYVQQYLGEANIPRDMRRLRKSTHQLMRRMGQPVIVKHMFNDEDARNGLAQSSPSVTTSSNLSAYGNQVRNRDPFSYGTGYCSIQTSPNEWIDPSTGAITTAPTSPSPTFIPAPMYRGYGPGYLTYIIEPDVAMDLFKLSPAGAIIKSESQTVVASWFPEINDNDLIINVELDRDGFVADTHERYQAKKSTPVSIRGLDRRGQREYSADHGNRHLVNQRFEMSLLPETSVLYQVESDR